MLHGGIERMQLDNCGNDLLPSARRDRKVRYSAVPADPAVGIGRTSTEATGRACRKSRRRNAAGHPDHYIYIATGTSTPHPLSKTKIALD